MHTVNRSLRILVATLLILGGVSHSAPPILTKQSSAPAFIRVNGSDRTLYAKSVALLISVENYVDWQPMKLDGPLDELEQVLSDSGFDVYRMRNPTGAVLRREVPLWISKVSAEQSLRAIVYFAGHGLTDQNQVGYIIPVDGKSTFSDNFRESAISASVVNDWAMSIKAKHSLFVFDSCMSGGLFLTRGNPRVERVPQNLSGSAYDRVTAPGVKFITASDDTMSVPVSSRFLPVLIRGIKGAADYTKDGYITGSELGEYVFQNLKSDPPYAPRYGDISRPGMSGDIIFTPSLTGKAQPTGAQGADLQPSAMRVPDGRLADYTVHYFRKTQDGRRVYSALDAANIRYVARPHSLPDKFESNTLGCHPDQPIDAVRELAVALIRGGVALKAIDAFDNRKEEKRDRLEILTNVRAVRGPVLTESDLQKLDKCKDFWLGPPGGGFMKGGG